MEQPRIDYDHLDIGDRLFHVLTAREFVVESSVSDASQRGRTARMCLTLPTYDGPVDIESLLEEGEHDGHFYLYGFIKLSAEAAA